MADLSREEVKLIGRTMAEDFVENYEAHRDKDLVDALFNDVWEAHKPQTSVFSLEGIMYVYFSHLEERYEQRDPELVSELKKLAGQP